MGTGGLGVPHSSGIASFARVWYDGSNQHAVARDPSDVESVRNLFKSFVRGSEGGVTKSQGRRMKSPVMRFEKCLSKVQVPMLISSDPS
jgi:hypothetical protein